MNPKYLNLPVAAALAVIGLGLFAAGNILDGLQYSLDVRLGLLAELLTPGATEHTQNQLDAIVGQTNATIRQIAEVARITGGAVALLGLVYAMIFCFCEWRIRRAANITVTAAAEKPG